MASRKLSDLEPGLEKTARQLIENCKDDHFLNVDILIYCTYRSPEEQAKLYRRSRALWKIQAKANKLSARGFDFLADILIDVGPQHGTLGEHVTYAGPGESWHNYREAFDAVPMIGGKCAWDPEEFSNYWYIYGNEASKLKLYWAGYWKHFREYPHCQTMPGGNPLKTLKKDMIESMLR